MHRRARIVLWSGLAIAATVVAGVLWFDPQDWKPLLLFATVVGAAAWGRGREVPADAPLGQAPLDDAAPIPEEPVR